MTEEMIREKLFDALVGEKNITVYYGGGDVKGSATGVLDRIMPGYVSFRDGPSVTVSAITGVLPGATSPDAVEFPAESYDVEILWERSEHATYLRERIRKGELVLTNDETGAGKIVNADPPVVTDLKAALSGGYRIKIDFIGCQRTGVVTSTARGTFKFMEDGDGCEHSHHFVLVRSVERVDAPDVAKERWEKHHDGSNLLIRDRDGLHLAAMRNTTVCQTNVMTHAPEVLEALEMTLPYLPGKVSDLAVTAIRKARGGE